MKNNLRGLFVNIFSEQDENYLVFLSLTSNVVHPVLPCAAWRSRGDLKTMKVWRWLQTPGI